MVSKKKSEWPPPDWKVEMKVSFNGRRYKSYINSKTGEKAYTRRDVLRCIRKGKRSNQESPSHETKQHPKSKPENKKMHVEEENGSLNLPPGWTLEWKIRQSGALKGTKYKCIIDPSTGSKFYSMPEVNRYLKSKKGSVGSSKPAKGEEIITNSENNSSVDPTSPQKSKLKKESPKDPEPTIHDKLSSGKTKSSVDPIKPEKSSLKKGLSEDSKPTVEAKLSSGKMKVVVERTSDEDFPSGWVKEIRIKKNRNNIRRDAFYIETASGLVFRSKSDALRYLKTGEISRHAYRRKINDLDENESPVGKTPPTPSSNIEKTSKGSKRKHVIDEVSPKQSTVLPLVTPDNNEEAQSKRITRSSLKTVHEMSPSKQNGDVSAGEAQSKRITRLSSKIQSPDICEPSLEQIPLSPGAQETGPAKPDGEGPSVGGQSRRRTRSSSEFQSASTIGPSLEQVPLLPEPAPGAQETGPVKLPSVEVQNKRRTSSSSEFQSASTIGPSPEQIPLSPEPALVAQETGPAKPDVEGPLGGQSKRRTRLSSEFQSASTIVLGLEQVPLLPEPASGAHKVGPAKPDGEGPSVEGQSKRRTRLSSEFQSAPTIVLSLEQVPLLPEPALGAHEMGPAKPDGEGPSVERQSKRRTSSSSEFQSVSTIGPSLEQVPLLPEPASASGAQEMGPAKSDGEGPSVGGQSKRRTRPSSEFQSASTIGPSPEQVPLLTKPATKAQEIVPSVGGQSKRRKSSARVRPASIYEPNLEQIPSLPEPNVGPNEAVPVEANGDVRQPEVHVINVNQSNAVPKETVHKSNVKKQGSRVRRTRVNRNTKDSKMSILSSHSAKPLAEVEPEVLSYDIPIDYSHSSIENCGNTDEIRLDIAPNESEQKAQAFDDDDDQHNVLTSQQQTSWAFDVNTPIVIQTQNDSAEKIDYIPQEYIEEIFLKDEGPPGFTEYPRSKITQSTIDELFEDPVDTITEDMVEKKSPEEDIIPQDQQETPSRTKTGKSYYGNCPIQEETPPLEKGNEQPGSQFCFPSPLWSDPCLEFAFKTLTGALPLDDNVAIQDYMEHQLRTCDQVHNNQQSHTTTGMSSFCQNDESKMGPPLPGDVGFTKPNSFNPHKSSR